MINPPTTGCAKCGANWGFDGVEPTYIPETPEHKEALAFSCARCGYTIETPTADAPSLSAAAGGDTL